MFGVLVPTTLEERGSWSHLEAAPHPLHGLHHILLSGTGATHKDPFRFV
jgi:hypothetical protein